MPETQYAVTYIAVCVMCAVIVAVLGLKMNKDVGVYHEVLFFRSFTTSSVVMYVADCIWGANLLVEGGLFPAWFMWIPNMLDLLASSTSAYFFFLFVMGHTLGGDVFAPRRFVRRASFAPQAILMLLHLTSPITSLTFSVTPDGAYVRGPLFALHLVVALGYLLTPSIRMLRDARNVSPTTRHEYLRYVLFLAIPVGGVLLQTFVGHAPFVGMAIAMAAVLLFLAQQEARVTTDALTQLTNRAKMNQVVGAKIKDADTTPFVLFIADVNRFKQINDIFGHTEGDRALVHVADAFRTLGKCHNSLFICRFGGDEFLLTLDQADLGLAGLGSPDDFINELSRELASINAEKNLPYQLTMAVGQQVISSPGIRVEDAIAAADKSLYDHKRNMAQGELR